MIRELVSRWQRNGEQTVFARYLNYPGSQFERLIKRSKLQESPETDIVDELAPLAAKATAVIDKNIYSRFTADGDSLVMEHGWTNLYVCGIGLINTLAADGRSAFA